MTAETRRSLLAILGDFLDNPPPRGLMAAFRLAVDGGDQVALVVTIEGPGLVAGPTIEVSIPSAEDAERAAGRFAAEYDEMRAEASTLRTLAAVATAKKAARFRGN